MRAVQDAGRRSLIGKVRDLLRRLAGPGSGLVGQGVRFTTAGGVAAVVYISTTTLLAAVVGLPFQVALAIGFSAGVVVHFALQRAFVWNHRGEFALPLHRQIGRYVALVVLQYGVTVATTSLLPPMLGLSSEVVYLITLPVLAGANFLIFGHGVFHASSVAMDHS